VRNQFGKGAVWYIGVHFDADGWYEVLPQILDDSGVDYDKNLPGLVEICRRAGNGRTLTFVINHTPEEKTLPIEEKGTDLLSGKKVSGKLTLPPYATAIIEVKNV